MMGVPSTGAAYGALALAAVLWGGSIVAQKLALGSFSAVEASVLRASTWISRTTTGHEMEMSGAGIRCVAASCWRYLGDPIASP